MPTLTPVDFDPFAEPGLKTPPGVKLTPVEHDPFKEVSTGEDVAKSVGTGVVSGLAGLAGMGKDIPSTIETLVNAGNKKLVDAGFPGAVPRNAPKVFDNPLPGQADVLKSITDKTGPLYEPQTTPGKYAKTVGEFLPGALTGPARSVGQVAGNVARFAVAPGVTSEAAGQLAQKVAPEYESAARIAAGLVTPGIASKVASPMRVGGPVASETSHAAQVARVEAEGIPVSAGERADSKGLRFVEDELNHNAYKDKLEAVTRAATRAVPGHEAPILEHGAGGNIDRMLTDVGGRFDHLAGSTDMFADGQLVRDLHGIRGDFTRVPGAYNPQAVAAAQGATGHVAALLHQSGGVMPGEQYQRLRSDLSRSARGATDPQHAEALHATAEALDDAMGRSMQRAGQDPAEWNAARRDYRNALVLEKAATASNVTGSQGYITPAALESAAKSVYGNRAHERGHDPFDWAPAAKSVLKVEPNSGTPGRVVLHGVNSAMGAGLGELFGSLAGHASGMSDAVEPLLIAGTMGGALGPMAMRPIERGLLSATGRYLGNQSMRGQAPAYQSVPGLLTAATAGRQ